MEKNEKAAVLYADGSPEFFRIYFANSCSQQLRIPPAFVAKFHGDVPQNFVLEGPMGRRWQIVVRKDDQSVFLQEGWPDFVNDNSLADEDFLTFCHDGDSNFYVKIFGRHACRKDVAITRKSSRKLVHPTDNAGEFSNTGVIGRRLRPRDDTGKVKSITLGPRNNATAKLSITSHNKRTLRSRDDTRKVRNITLGPRDDAAVKSSIPSINKRTLRPRDRDDAGKVRTTTLNLRDDAVVKLSITSLNKRTLRLKDDASKSSNTRLTGRTKSPRDNAGNFISTQYTRRKLRARDETGKVISNRLALTESNIKF